MIDKQRVAAVKKLEELGYTFAEGELMAPGHGAVAPKITDALHALLVKRADELDGSMWPLGVNPPQSRLQNRSERRWVHGRATALRVLHSAGPFALLPEAPEY